MKIFYQSFVKETIKILDDSEIRLRTKAAQHLKKKMKEKVSDIWEKGTGPRPGEPPAKRGGDLAKGIMYVNDDVIRESKVGVGPPAYHAHLMEFGTQNRTVLNYGGVKGKQVNVGRVLPRPFVQPTFEEEAETVKNILSEQWA
jgi:hypothetical protein